MANFRIIGLAEFDAQLQTLDASLQRKALIEVAKAGAEILRDAAKALAPRGESGDLADGITMIEAPTRALREATVNVGPGADQFYGLFVEKGTRERFYKKGRQGSSGVMPRQPFMGPAFDANVGRMTQAIQEKIQEIIDRATK